MIKTKYLSLIMALVILGSGLTLFQFGGNDPGQFHLAVLGSNVREAEYEETVEYQINVVNEAGESRSVQLQLENVPQHWEASLDRDNIRLAPGSRTTVKLSVTAPSIELEKDPTLDRVAAIGVRANNNETVGTLTFLEGDAELLRDGEIVDLEKDDLILSGDIITSTGDAVINITLTELVENETLYKGDLYVLLSNAKVSFLSKENKVYLTVVHGNVTVYVAGGGGGGGRADPGQPHLNLNPLGIIDEEFPGMEYSLVMELDTEEVPTTFFHLDVVGNETNVEVYDGGITVGNETTTRSLARYETTTMNNQVRTISEPEPVVEKTIVSVRSTNSTVDPTLESGGENVLDREDVFYLPTSHGDFFITPRLPDLTLDVKGNADDEYELDFSTINNFTAQSFNVRSRTTIRTGDSFVYREDTLAVKEMDEEKTYDLAISYENSSSGESREQTLPEVPSSKEEQEIVVEDWKEVGEEESEVVSFKEGSREVTVMPGTTGQELGQELESLKEGNEEMDWQMFGIFGLAFLLLAVCLFPFIGRRDGGNRPGTLPPAAGDDGSEECSGDQVSGDRFRLGSPGPEVPSSAPKPDESGPVVPWLTAEPQRDKESIPEPEPLQEQEELFETPLNRKVSLESPPAVGPAMGLGSWDDLSRYDGGVGDLQEPHTQDREPELRDGVGEDQDEPGMPWDGGAFGDDLKNEGLVQEDDLTLSTEATEPGDEEFIPSAEPEAENRVSPEESSVDEPEMPWETEEPAKPEVTIQEIEKDFVDLNTINVLKNEIADIAVTVGKMDLDDKEWWDNWNAWMDRVTKGLKDEE